MIDSTDKSNMLDRREFLRRCVVGGVGVALLPFPSLGAGSFGWQSSQPDARSGPPKGRIDGYPKVTGSKLYSADFRAADMPGWPSRTSHAMLLRARDVTHVFAGIDLFSLEPSLQPDRTVLAEDLAKAQLRVPDLCRRLAMSHWAGAGLSWSALGAADLERLRRFC
jgi:hypothetical protein